MRIVGGRLRGRVIKGPSHDGLRPTADRVREAVFNILAHGIEDFELEGSNVLDLFAGTGALGLEAMSRGASYCLFVDNSAEARGLIRDNIDTCTLAGTTRIFRRDATDMGPAGRHDRFSLVFADPPYGAGLGEKALESVASGGWLIDGAIAVLEERRDTPIEPPASYVELDRRAYADTEVIFLRYQTASTR